MSGKGFVDIVYSTGSKMLRSVHMNCTAVLSAGESKLTVTGAQYDQAGGAEACLKSFLGVAKLPDPTCAVIDKDGTVIGLINADAAVDSLPGVTLKNTTLKAVIGSPSSALPVSDIAAGPPVVVVAEIG